jgi:hypothetical protein
MLTVTAHQLNEAMSLTACGEQGLLAPISWRMITGAIEHFV